MNTAVEAEKPGPVVETKEQPASIVNARKKTIFSDKLTQNYITDLAVLSGAGEISFHPRDTIHRPLYSPRTYGLNSMHHLPDDLRLGELPQVAQKIDPESPARFSKVGEDIRKAAAYLDQQKDAITQGRPIAEATIADLDGLGQEFQGKEAQGPVTLDPADESALDEQFWVNKLAAVQGIDNPSEQQRQQLRREMTNHLFGIAEQAAEGSEPHQRRLKRISGIMLGDKVTDTPFLELQKAIILGGNKNLVDAIGSNGWNEQASKELGIEPGTKSTLRELVGFDNLKQQLADARATGNIEDISAKEVEVAGKIQDVINSIPYQKMKNTAPEIYERQQRNCTASTNMGLQLLSELGIKSVVADVPLHNLSLLVTSDGKVRFQDFTGPANLNEEITDEDIQGKTHDGRPVTVKDIVRLTEDPNSPDITVNLVSDRYKDRYTKFNGDPRNWMIISPAERGIQANLFTAAGRKMGLAKKIDEAVLAYNYGIRTAPAHPYPYLNLSNALTNAGIDDVALTAADEGIKLGLNEGAFHNAKGTALNKLQRQEEAKAELKKAVDLNPYEINFHTDLWNGQFATGDYASAGVTLLDSFPYIKQHGNVLTGIVQNNLMKVFAKTGHPHLEGLSRKGQHIFTKDLDNVSVRAQLYNFFGTKFSTDKKYESALDAYKKAVAAQPDNVGFLNDLAGTQNDLKDHESAAMTLAGGLQHVQQQDAPGKSNIYYQLHRTFDQMGKIDEAQRALRQAYALQPGDENFKNRYIELQAQAGKDKLPDAVQLLSDGEERQLQADLLTVVGEAYTGKGRPEDASRAFTQAGKLAPENTGLQVDLGNKQVLLGKHSAAINTLLHALPHTEPEDASGRAKIYGAAANAFALFEDPETAILSAHRAAASNPDDLSHKERFDMFQQVIGTDKSARMIDRTKGLSEPEFQARLFQGYGDKLLLGNNAEGAVDAYKEAVSLSPKEIKYKNTLGYAQYRLRQYETAGETLLGAIDQVDPQNPEDTKRKAFAYYILGHSFDDLGKPDDTNRAITQAYALKPEDKLISRSYLSLQSGKEDEPQVPKPLTGDDETRLRAGFFESLSSVYADKEKPDDAKRVKERSEHLLQSITPPAENNGSQDNSVTEVPEKEEGSGSERTIFDSKSIISRQQSNRSSHEKEEPEKPVTGVLSPDKLSKKSRQDNRTGMTNGDTKKVPDHVVTSPAPGKNIHKPDAIQEKKKVSSSHSGIKQ